MLKQDSNIPLVLLKVVYVYCIEEEDALLVIYT